MTINKDSEAVRQLNVESAYFYTETGKPGDSLSGPEAAAIKMTNDEGQRCTLAHHHSGITRFETEGEMIVSAGEKTPSGNSDFILVTNSGDVDVVAEDGNGRRRADNNITLDADNIVSLKKQLETLEVIGEYQGKPTPDMFAVMLNQVGREFGNAMMVVEIIFIFVVIEVVLVTQV